MMTPTDISDSLAIDKDELTTLMDIQKDIGNVSEETTNRIMQNASDAAKNLANNNKKITQDIAPLRRRKKSFI